jgi:hypothetical protein
VLGHNFYARVTKQTPEKLLRARVVKNFVISGLVSASRETFCATVCKTNPETSFMSEFEKKP